LISLNYENVCKDYLETPPVELMAKKAKSFYFASVIFSKERLHRVATLYKLCRLIDDCADELRPTDSLNAIQSLLYDLEHPNINTRFNRLVREVEQYGVERRHIKQLVIGANFDSQGRKIENTADLMLYCYRVAGVVGLMMCSLIGVKDESAFPHAIDLGIGMQLTNIARDVKEDAQRGRVYLPKKWDPKLLANSKQTPKELKQQIRELLRLSETYYDSGFRGLSYIPIRPRIVITIAAQLYRHIGIKILQNDCEVLGGRTQLSFFEKVIVALKSAKAIFQGQFWKKGQHEKSLHSSLGHVPGVNL
tara:strand:- start:156121 stop:157038 length:918 start_codon:yes stop_codon:yes gene_type:complete